MIVGYYITFIFIIIFTPRRVYYTCCITTMRILLRSTARRLELYNLILTTTMVLNINIIYVFITQCVFVRARIRLRLGVFFFFQTLGNNPNRNIYTRTLVYVRLCDINTIRLLLYIIITCFKPTLRVS